MNDEIDDRRLRRAVRGALDDIVATAPDANGPSEPRRTFERSGRGPWLHIAAGLTAAAGILGIVAVANRDDDTPAAGDASDAPTTLAAPIVTTGPPAATDAPTTPAGPSTPTTAAAAVPATVPDATTCGAASVPDAAANVQSVAGDIDGDGVDDTVTLYSVGTVWRVHVTSSVRSTASDAIIDVELDDAIETASVRLADIDSPAAIMVSAGGPNDLGITANFTFLTLNRDYCVEQWVYRNAQGVDEPFQWVALQEPGHVTGMICEGEPGARRYRLVDSEQNADGSWRVVNRVLTHDFTRAEISFPPDDTVPDSPDFAAHYGAIVGCD